MAGGINTFGYVQGNPLNYSDPLGLCAGLACAPIDWPDWMRDTHDSDEEEYSRCQFRCFIDPSTTIVTMAITKGIGTSSTGAAAAGHTVKAGGKGLDVFNISKCLLDCDEEFPNCAAKE